MIKNNVLISNQKYSQPYLPVMVMGVAEPMITVICHMSFIRMKNLSPDIDFIKNNAL